MSLISSNPALGALTREWQLLMVYAFTFAGKPHPFLASIGCATCFIVSRYWLRRAYLQLRGRGPIKSIQQLYEYVRKTLYGWFLELPFVAQKVSTEVSGSLEKVAEKLLPSCEVQRYTKLPQTGWELERVESEIDKLAAMEHVRWEDGRVSGAVYHGGRDLTELQTKTYGVFAVANPIHPDVFPAVRKMEAEIVSMVLSLFNAPDGSAGVCTSGGTESILSACFAARERARMERGIRKPEMIIPVTAHPAFRKAGHYFNIKVHEVECPAPTYRADTRAVARLINSNTALIVGSAPNFPHGVVDNITELSRIALRNRVGLHVDCCLGSFLLPFLSQAGFETEPFDFRLPGVVSISCDTHKYGFAPKGSSVVLYRSSKLRSYQYYIEPDWCGGLYVSPGMMGSRPGALIAGCWASMMSQGQSGYLEACRQIVGSAKKIETALRSKPFATHVQVIGKPLVSVVAFTSKSLNIWAVADEMSGRGWHLNAMQNPPAIHIAVTMPVAKVDDQLLQDLAEVVQEEVAKLEKRRLEGSKEEGTPGDSVALYGVAGSLPSKGVVVKLANGYLDTLYRT
ncbi:PLP-dependent transferase [Hyaloscypha variabilis F]|uniref:sphinganine-1-phosphate aldolase n=1 Tax=Hyaloscypha variabilis (strain UAMH 11265 / GT02V1 / F) TaxID=1149755 RepID=A0A2J6S5M9_HYAVF|nr:PLP-dependent transferase [Hyaloscypha variabilis F]